MPWHVPIGRRARSGLRRRVDAEERSRQGFGRDSAADVVRRGADDDWSEPAKAPQASDPASARYRRRCTQSIRAGRAVRARSRPRRTSVVSGRCRPLSYLADRTAAGRQQGRGRGARPHAWSTRSRRTASRRSWSARRSVRRSRATSSSSAPASRSRRVTSLNRDIAYAMAADRRAHPGADPGSLGHRRRGAEPHSPAGQPRRRHDVGRGQDGDAPARRRHRQGHRRPVGVPEPGDHAAPADRRHHRRRQVERPQLHPHLDPHAQSRPTRCG